MLEQIKHIRIINGDELFGTVVEDVQHKKIIISNPMVLEEKYDQDGQTTMVLSRYVPFSIKDEITIKDDHVVYCEDVHVEMERYYMNSLYYSKKRENAILENISTINRIMEEMYTDEMFNKTATHAGTSGIN